MIYLEEQRSCIQHLLQGYQALHGVLLGLAHTLQEDHELPRSRLRLQGSLA